MSVKVASETLKNFVSRLESLAVVAEEAEYLLKKDPIEIKEGDFNENVSFRQVWFYKGKYCLAFTQYDASEPNWFCKDQTIAKLLELEADQRLGLPSGTQMLECVDCDESIKSKWKFVRFAAGPANPLLLAFFNLEIYSLIFVNNENKLFKLYLTSPIGKDEDDLLAKLANSIINK